MRLDDIRQRLISYAAAVAARDLGVVKQGVMADAWDNLTDEEREALMERLGDYCSGPRRGLQ